MDNKDEYPPLLQAGFHTMTVAELRKLCVDRFPLSKRREPIMDGLEQVLGRLNATGITAEAWIDGSFLTEKLEPEDFDMVVRVTSADYALCTPAQMDVLDWLNSDLKAVFLCDGYSFVEYEKDHSRAAIGEWMRAYWIRQFGFSRENELKGMAVVLLPLAP